MKHKRIFLLIAALGVAFAYWFYLSLEPNRHFQKAEIPILTVPRAQPTPLSRMVQPGVINYPVQTAADETPKSTKEEEKSFNLLILGTDAINNEDSRSDVIIIAHVIPAEKKAVIVSIPRDSRVLVEGVGYTKINHAHIIGELQGGNKAGTQVALQTVSSFLNIPINYYIKSNFKGFVDFIDEIGGIDIEIQQDIFLGESNLLLKAGKQHIDGATTLSLVRERHSLSNGDFGRQFNQSQVLKEIAIKLLQPKVLPKLPKLLNFVKKDIEDTNFSNKDLISLAWLFNGMKASDFEYIQIPGVSRMDMDPLVKSKVWYWIPDMDEVKGISEKYLQNDSNQVTTIATK